jgi:hypothetical protein
VLKEKQTQQQERERNIEMGGGGGRSDFTPVMLLRLLDVGGGHPLFSPLGADC